MKKKISVRDFYKVLQGTIYEKNYGLILNAIAIHEHTMHLKYKDKICTRNFKEVGDKVFDFLYENGYYDID